MTLQVDGSDPLPVVRPRGSPCLPCCLLLVFGCLAVAGSIPAGAQESSAESSAEPALPSETIERALAAQEDEAERDSHLIPPARPVPLSIDSLDEESRAVLFQRYRRYQRHHIAMLEHRERVFGWQLRANQISFWMVLVLVLSGLVFAGIQFRVSMLAASESDEISETMQELSLGAQGITIRSSVIGLIILALSLGFFYLYLVYVFPLDELQSQAATEHGATEREAVDRAAADARQQEAAE